MRFCNKMADTILSEILVKGWFENEKEVPVLAKNSNSISRRWEGTGDATAYISERFFCSLGLKS